MVASGVLHDAIPQAHHRAHVGAACRRVVLAGDGVAERSAALTSRVSCPLRCALVNRSRRASRTSLRGVVMTAAPFVVCFLVFLDYRQRIPFTDASAWVVFAAIRRGASGKDQRRYFLRGQDSDVYMHIVSRATSVSPVRRQVYPRSEQRPFSFAAKPDIG